jgi:hypothetical protein
MVLMLCGEHFTPGDKVTVVLEYPEHSQSLDPVTVDAHGQFEDRVPVARTHMPIAIATNDQAHSRETALLVDIPRGCMLT